MSLLINNFNNFVLNYISKKYNLDSYGYQLLSSVMVSATTYIEQQNITNCEFDIYEAYADSYQYYPYVFGIICIIALYRGYYSINSLMSKKYKIITLENAQDSYGRLMVYMDYNKKYFTTKSASELHKGSNKIYTDKIYFNDPSFESNGYIQFEFQKIVDPSDDKKTLEIIITKIYIRSSSKFAGESYLKHMGDYNIQCHHNRQDATLCYYKLLHNDYIRTKIFAGPKNVLDEENVVLYKTYFSQYKYLIDLFANGTVGCNNIMCYGSPGVGKSRFIYLCSRMMHCHIYSIDLSQYVNNKTLLMKMFNGMDFNLNPGSTALATLFSSMFSHDKKCIIALDEFDYAIEKIIENSKVDNNEITLDPTGKVITTNKLDRLELSDLLELFQGSVPMPNRYIIANTNNFHKINNLIPALFRPGRMTSIEFKHITWDILNEITMHYYEQEMTHKPLNITIPTSLIIEEIQNYKQMEKSFDEFEQHLINLLKASL